MLSSTAKNEDQFRALCALSKLPLNGEQAKQVARGDRLASDWPEMMRMADHHGVLGLLAHNLVEHVPDLPPEISSALRSSYDINLKRGLWFSAELARIVQHFELRQVAVLPFKGPLLAESVYGDVGLRSFSDLDFLISSSDFDRAKRALAEIGYSPSKKMAPAVEGFWLRKGYEQSFHSASGQNLVELQWALLPPLFAIGLNVEDLFARSGHAVLAGQPVRSLSAEDSLLVLSVHAAKHLWGRLVWLVDIAGTMRIEKIDYEPLFARARSLGILRILGVTFWLVKNVLETELPKPAEELITKDQKVPLLGQLFVDRLARTATYDFVSTEYFWLVLKCRERRGDRLRYLWRLFSTPGEGDIESLYLPERLFPFYRVVRMGRLFGRLTRTKK
jgi:hypothetical protein